MKLHNYLKGSLSNDRGVSLIELLVGVTMASVFLIGVMAQFRVTAIHSYDNETVSRAEETSRTLLDTVAYDLRMLGSGMPLGQSNFNPGDAGLGDAPLAVLLSSDGTTIDFRMNQKGRHAVLTADYIPTPADVTIPLSDTSDFIVGDLIYISNMTSGADEGLQGEINTVTANNVIIDVGYITTAGATFEAGSLVTRVSEVTYQSGLVAGNISRTDEAGVVDLANNATLSFEYLDSLGNSLTLPLTDAVVADVLAAVRVAVSVQGEKALLDGITYVAQMEQVIALRNLNLSRS